MTTQPDITHWTVLIRPREIEVLIHARSAEEAEDIAAEIDMTVLGDDCERERAVGVLGTTALAHLRDIGMPEYERDADGDVRRARRQIR